MSSWYAPLLMVLLLAAAPCSAGTIDPPSKEEQQVEVAMRLIGHEVLLAAGDSSSIVRPVERVGDRYRVRFTNDFGFEPSVMTATVDSVVRTTKVATRYLVEFVSCDTNVVVHSWQAALVPENAMMPCMGRSQPVACYELWFTILERDMAAFQGVAREDRAGITVTPLATVRWWWLLIPALLLIGAAVVLARKRRRPSEASNDPNVVRIGGFLFNTRNMELSFKNERVRLTSKEADLLQLLSASPNDTVERETILATVWGDEGDYVGRTLDVFVSKLRKKLEADANVRIVNIRGVGYRLVLGE
ncbi:MAG: response regulator transcription factor [Flavobacteriales bacterium]